MKSLLTYLVVFLVNLSFAQTSKAIYFDANWKKTTKDNAHYYREVKKERPKLYLIQDFYLNGQLQMNGHYLDKKATIKTGVFTYFDSLERKQQETHYSNGKGHGLHTLYYPNGNVRLKVSYKHGKRHGEYAEFYENGNKRATAEYVQGNLRRTLLRFYENGDSLMKISLDDHGSGTFEAYFQGGNIMETGTYIEGMRGGVWYEYNQAGEMIASTSCDHQKKREEFEKQREEKNKGRKRTEYVEGYSEGISAVFFDEKYVLNNINDGKIVPFPDVDATYPGGVIAMQRYISEHVIYPEKALKRNKMSRVYARFVVEPDGSITNVDIIKGHRLFHDEVVRILENMPKWHPGEVNGRKARTRCTIPINFTLD